MPASMQEFLVQATRKAAEDVEAALLKLPEDRRTWAPTEKARTALDQLAEIAILNGHVADLLASGKWMLGEDFGGFIAAKAALAQDLPGTQALLKTNVAKVIAAIEAVPETDYAKSIDMPWGPMTVTQIMAYPYWNMSYHEGQINYIASML